MSQAQAKHHSHHKQDTSTLLGFWIYLMTDLVMFGVLFASYAVLRDSTFGGPTGKELFHLPFVLTETLILLTSSFTMGLAMLSSYENKANHVIRYLAATLTLGTSFLILELYEFNALIAEGASYTASAFLSSYFTLVGTHGAHIAAGLLWIILMIFLVLKRGLTPSTNQKLMLLSLFWHFLDVVWIFIFTIVYLMGAIQ